MIKVVMPAWNESDGLPDFLLDLTQSLGDIATFLVVDDCSTDDTLMKLRQCRDGGIPVTWVTNTVNLGHGRSTTKAWHLGLLESSDLIVSVDGDGQFLGSDVASLIEAVQDSEVAVGEGVRTNRSDGWYRRATSFATRVLVWSRCGSWPKDANTPLRVFRPEILAELADAVPSDSLTPNLFISAIARKRNLSVIELPVRSIPRRGTVSFGTTWGNRRKSIPTKRFVAFCLRAAQQWIRSAP